MDDVSLSRSIVEQNFNFQIWGMERFRRGAHKEQFSCWWSDLRSTINHSSMADVSSQFIWKLGRGDQILFWEDSWVERGIRLKDKFPELYHLSSQKFHTVATMGTFCESGWEWSFSWRRNLFDSEMGRASEFIDQTAAIRPSTALKDSWLWGADSKGIFSTNSAYLYIKDDHLNEDQCLGFQHLWNIKIPPRALVFAWRLLWDRLPTKDNLLRRNVTIDNDLCPFCQNKTESASHLFFLCPKVMPLWWEFSSWVKEPRVLHWRPLDNFIQHFSTAGLKDTNRKWKIWWIAATTSIWNLRNDIIFNNKPFVISKLVDNTIFLSWSWMRGWEKDFHVPFHQWSSAMAVAFK